MHNNHQRITLALQCTFLIFAMVLNSMGIVILRLSEEKISFQQLGFLDSFKDFPIAIISLFAVSFISKFGAKKSVMTALAVVAFCSLLLPFVDSFWFYKLWFGIIGACFAVGKICVFSIIKNNFLEEKVLAKTMNSVEAFYMIGSFGVNMGFGLLIASRFENYWKFGFLGISLICFYTLYLFFITPIFECKTIKKETFSHLKGVLKPVFLAFFGLAFFIVFTEQIFNSWLPTFYRQHLGVNSFLALQASALLPFFSFLGRIITSRIIKSFSLSKYYFFCTVMILMIVMAIMAIQLYHREQSYALLIIFPMIGFFLGPIFPVVSSKIISHTENEKVNIVTSVAVICSSLGSAVSSILLSLLFQKNLLNFFGLYVFIAVLVLLIIGISFFKFFNNKLQK